MKAVRHHIPRPSKPSPSTEEWRRYKRKKRLLTWPCLLAGSALGAPGLGIRLRLALASARRIARGQATLKEVYPFIFDSFDTVRHFEFQICWNWLRTRQDECALDLSSPRILPFLLASSGAAKAILMLNPDSSDLECSKSSARVLGVDSKITFQNSGFASLANESRRFGIVTSISVLEHIPSESDQAAFNALWELVVPGGTLVVTVPCARSAFEEFIDFNQYGLLKEDEDGFVFGQRFYDAAALSVLHKSAGTPTEARVFGERTPGIFFEDRSRKCRSWLAEDWKEPLVTARHFRQYERIDDLPGIGVVALRFDKS